MTIIEWNTGVPPSCRWARGPVEYDNPPYGMTISDDPVTNNPFRFVTVGQRTGRFLAFPADAYEILAFAAESKTTPLGASVGNGHSTAGPVGGNVDLMNGLSEEQKLREGQEDHSGQFRGTNMIRWEIWEQLLQKTGLPSTFDE